MKRLLNLILFFLVPALLRGSDNQNSEKQQDYKMSMTHGRMINANTFEFDVAVKSSGKFFVLDNYQCAFVLGDNLAANSIQFDYISNSSELKNFPFIAAAVTDEEGETKLVFASRPSGTDTIFNEVKVGKFILRLVNPAKDSLLSINWSFKGDINTIVSSSSKNVTNPANHIDFKGNASGNGNESLLPKFYSLSQNFPNPFNPSTSIRFALPSDSKIKISVYNSLGELVVNLADKVEQAGNHELTWNASGISSGMYIYTIDAEPLKGGNSFKSVKKMMLLK